jgi:hypothetical protein
MSVRGRRALPCDERRSCISAPCSTSWPYTFLLRFTKKPLRFFGSIGILVLIPGLLFTGGLAIARLVYEVPLADRPALILGVLMIVLGIQIIALGLIGEIVIFASGKRIKDYTVEKIV